MDTKTNILIILLASGIITILSSFIEIQKIGIMGNHYYGVPYTMIIVNGFMSNSVIFDINGIIMNYLVYLSLLIMGLVLWKTTKRMK